MSTFSAILLALYLFVAADGNILQFFIAAAIMALLLSLSKGAKQ